MALPGFRGVKLGAFARGLYKKIGDDALTDAAAQLAYYLIFAIFPLLFVVVTLTAYLPLGNAENELLARLGNVMPAQAFDLLHQHLDDLLHRQRPRLMTGGVLVAMYSASRGADAFRKLLNIAYDVHETRPFWKTNLIALGFTLSAATLALAGLAMILAGGDAGLWLANHGGFGSQFQAVWCWLRWPATALVIMLVAALAYYWLPDVEQRFRYITPGSVIATLCWLASTWGFTEYAAHFGSFNVTYGSLGGAVVLLTWFYISSVVFMLGGEINAVVEHLSADGKARGAHKFGEPPAPPQERPSAAPPGAAKDASIAAAAHARAEDPHATRH